MRKLLAASLATAVAAITIATVSAGALQAQDGSDDARMRAQEPHDHHRWRRGRRLIQGLRIADVARDGTIIRLRDGTVWEVYLPDRTSTAEWREGDFVIVKLAPIGQHLGPQAIYTYQLFNGRAQSRAVVQLRGREER